MFLCILEILEKTILIRYCLSNRIENERMKKESMSYDHQDF